MKNVLVRSQSDEKKRMRNPSCVTALTDQKQERGYNYKINSSWW